MIPKCPKATLIAQNQLSRPKIDSHKQKIACQRIKMYSERAKMSLICQNSTLRRKKSTPKDLKSTLRCTKIYSFRHKINPSRNKNNSQRQKLTPKAQKSIIRYPPLTFCDPNCFENLKSIPRRPKLDPHRLKIDS